MRLLATTCAFLGFGRIQASPLVDTNRIRSYVEKVSPSGHFENLELQQRAFRFLNQATASMFCTQVSVGSLLT